MRTESNTTPPVHVITVEMPVTDGPTAANHQGRTFQIETVWHRAASHPDGRVTVSATLYGPGGTNTTLLLSSGDTLPKGVPAAPSWFGRAVSDMLAQVEAVSA